MKPDSSSPSEQQPDASSVDTATATFAAGVGEAAASVGDLLRLAREKAGLSLGDVASRLRMGVKQVRALEQNDFPSLPQGTFLRGFVRNFAKQVGVKPELALNLLEATHQSAAAISASANVLPLQQNINVPSPGGERATPRGRIIIAFVISVLLVTVIWWWWENVRPYRAEGGRPKAVAVDNTIQLPAAATAPSHSIAPLPAEATPTTDNVAQQTEPPVDARLPPLPTPTPSAPIVSAVTTPSLPSAAEGAPAAPPASRAGNGILGLTFSDKSWVQVVDVNGKTVLDRTFKGGDAEEINGRSPFSVVVGNAKATRLAYNGKEVDLAPHTRAAVARLTVK